MGGCGCGCGGSSGLLSLILFLGRICNKPTTPTSPLLCVGNHPWGGCLAHVASFKELQDQGLN